jgi:hypothetical protein
VYIAVIAMYLVLILFFFPETRYALSKLDPVKSTTDLSHRNMTIEEVSVLFDTGRKGDAAAATRKFHNSTKMDDMLEEVDDPEKEGTVQRVEKA